MKSKIRDILSELEGVITPELLTFWEDLIEDQIEDGTKASEAVFTFNLKKGIEAASDFGECVPWFPETTQANTIMRDFLYNYRYNIDRDRIRFKLEEAFPKEASNGMFDHLEIFTSREMLKARYGESAKNARLRHLVEGTLPMKRGFIAAVSAHTEDDFLRVLSEFYLNDNDLFMLEALMSSIHKKELDDVYQENKWLSDLGYTGSWSLRPTKIRRLRQCRWLGWEVMPGYILAQIVEFKFDENTMNFNKIPDPIDSFIVVPVELSKVVKLVVESDQVEVLRYRQNHALVYPGVKLTDYARSFIWSKNPLQAIHLFKQGHIP